MTYAYGMKNAPAVGQGLGGLPRRETGKKVPVNVSGRVETGVFHMFTQQFSSRPDTATENAGWCPLSDNSLLIVIYNSSIDRLTANVEELEVLPNGSFRINTTTFQTEKSSVTDDFTTTPLDVVRLGNDWAFIRGRNAAIAYNYVTGVFGDVLATGFFFGAPRSVRQIGKTNRVLLAETDGLTVAEVSDAGVVTVVSSSTLSTGYSDSITASMINDIEGFVTYNDSIDRIFVRGISIDASTGEISYSTSAFNLTSAAGLGTAKYVVNSVVVEGDKLLVTTSASLNTCYILEKSGGSLSYVESRGFPAFGDYAEGGQTPHEFTPGPKGYFFAVSLGAGGAGDTFLLMKEVTGEAPEVVSYFPYAHPRFGDVSFQANEVSTSLPHYGENFARFFFSRSSAGPEQYRQGLFSYTWQL